MVKNNAGDDTPIIRDPAWQATWETEDNYWFDNFTSRPYALGADFYDRFRPAYRYGFESAHHGMGRTWEEAEPDLRRGWDSYERRGTDPSPWDEIKEAVRDAWERVSGAKTAPSEGQNPQVRE